MQVHFVDDVMRFETKAFGFTPTIDETALNILSGPFARFEIPQRVTDDRQPARRKLPVNLRRSQLTSLFDAGLGGLGLGPSARRFSRGLFG
jgi:hypothetical protein